MSQSDTESDTESEETPVGPDYSVNTTLQLFEVTGCVCHYTLVMRRLVLTFAVFFELSSGTDLCSVSETNVTCSTCSDVCRGREDSCFKCPTGCGANCTSTCSVTCLFGACKYTSGRVICTHGCKEGWTGIFCQELCPQNCALCDQYKSKCLSCVEGHHGDKCTDTATTGVEHNPNTTNPTGEQETTPSETERTESASSSVKCVDEDCDPPTGVTTDGCADGNQGSNCSHQDNAGAKEWLATSIGIGLAGAVVLILCAAVGYKLYKVHGCPQRDIEVTNERPALAPPVQFAIGDDAGGSGIYSYIFVKESR